jgi:hypothetical protein
MLSFIDAPVGESPLKKGNNLNKKKTRKFLFKKKKKKESHSGRERKK